MKKNLISSFILVSLISIGVLGAKEYDIDKSHSEVGFQTKHLKIAIVNGKFDSFTGKIDIDSKTNKINSLEGEVDISTINTSHTSRDGDLKKSNYFDAEKFPKATLKMISHKGNKVVAELTLKGITKKITFDADLQGPIIHPMNNKEVYSLSLSQDINRKDFNIAPDVPSALVDDNVKIKINMELLK